MRIQTGLSLFVPCVFVLCVGLAACTASAPEGPDVTVSTPSVGRPPPPSSVQAALSRMAFTPYAALGESDNDGLAPGASDFALTAACMTAAGYPDSGNVPIAIRQAQAGLVFGQPWGGWGYLGDAAAQQYGFRMQPGAALSQLGIGTGAASAPDPATLPQAERAAQQKCSAVVGDFDNTVGNGPLAGIATLTNDIYNDVLEDPAVKHATQAWGACMARNGYSFRQPQTVFRAEIQDMDGGVHFINAGATVSAAANRAQIAAAVADAGCTDSADLAGIYFAVQASYEQQIVNTNQQALTDAVQQYRAAYAKELRRLPSLLQTAKASPATSAEQRPPASPSPTSAAS